jgi:hypothetical protein
VDHLLTGAGMCSAPGRVVVVELAIPSSSSELRKSLQLTTHDHSEEAMTIPRRLSQFQQNATSQPRIGPLRSKAGTC